MAPYGALYPLSLFLAIGVTIRTRAQDYRGNLI
jgi:hypothetical protein